MQHFKSKITQFTLKRNPSDFLAVKIRSSNDSFHYISQFFFDDIDIYESCFILLLNAANNTIGYAKISQGGITSTVVDVRIIAKYAIEALAVSVVLAHNHPSGNLNPSEPDKRLTQKVKETLNVMDIKLMDHLIITTNGYYSFADSGML